MKMFGLFVDDLKDGLWVEFDQKGIEILNLHYSSGFRFNRRFNQAN